MSKRVGNRTGREAKKRAQRHARRSAETGILRAFLAAVAAPAIKYGRSGPRPVGLRRLMRVTLEIGKHQRAREPGLRFLIETELDKERIPLGAYRYGLSVSLMPRVYYMDGS